MGGNVLLIQEAVGHHLGNSVVGLGDLFCAFLGLVTPAADVRSLQTLFMIKDVGPGSSNLLVLEYCHRAYEGAGVAGPAH